MLVFSTENDDAGDAAVAMTVEEAVEKLESSGIEVRAARNPAEASRTGRLSLHACSYRIVYATPGLGNNIT